MKPEHLIKLGFKLVDEYNHDEFYTKHFKKGVVMADITYRDDTYLTWDISIEDIPYLQVTFPELKKLDKILNKTS